jgi:hypothetical protein
MLECPWRTMEQHPRTLHESAVYYTGNSKQKTVNYLQRIYTIAEITLCVNLPGQDLPPLVATTADPQI